jgi:hypothetical protein
MGALDLPLVGRELEAGEIFEIDDALAGRPPETVVDEETGEESIDLGEGLLAQVGNFEQAPPMTDWTRAELEAFARRRGLDVSGAKNKAAAITAIESGTSVPSEELS